MNIIFLSASFIFGSLIGSFLNVVILRLPREQKITGRSMCPRCGHGLSAWDMLPFFSYLLLGGRCRYCRGKISPRYFAIELITALLFAVGWQVLMPVSAAAWLLLFKFWVAAAVLVAVFVIDWEHFIILDSVLITGSVFALFINLLRDILQHSGFAWHGYFVSGLVAAAAGSLPFFLLWLISHGEWIGFGDVKLGLLLGLLLGWPQIYAGYFIAFILGGFISLGLVIFAHKGLKTRLPFGTFLSVGTIIALLFGPRLLAWYLAFLGF